MLSQIYALFGVLFTGLNDVAVYKYEVCMGDGWFKLITWKNGMQGLMRRIRPPINRQDAYNGEPRTRKHVRNISSSMPWRSTWDIGRPSAINCFVWGNWPSLTWGGFHQVVWQKVPVELWLHFQIIIMIINNVYQLVSCGSRANCISTAAFASTLQSSSCRWSQVPIILVMDKYKI